MGVFLNPSRIDQGFELYGSRVAGIAVSILLTMLTVVSIWMMVHNQLVIGPTLLATSIVTSYIIWICESQFRQKQFMFYLKNYFKNLSCPLPRFSNHLPKVIKEKAQFILATLQNYETYASRGCSQMFSSHQSQEAMIMGATTCLVLHQQYHLLCAGQDVNLPAYYHATKFRYINSIIDSKKVKRTHAILGYGAYVSTNDEWRIYGNDGRENAGGCTLAFTKGAIENIPHSLVSEALFLDNNRTLSKWWQLRRDIPVNEKTVAYIAIDPKQRNPYIHKINTHFKNGNPIPIIDRKILDIMRYVLQSTALDLQASKRLLSSKSPRSQ